MNDRFAFAYTSNESAKAIPVTHSISLSFTIYGLCMIPFPKRSESKAYVRTSRCTIALDRFSFPRSPILMRTHRTSAAPAAAAIVRTEWTNSKKNPIYRTIVICLDTLYISVCFFSSFRFPFVRLHWNKSMLANDGDRAMIDARTPKWAKQARQSQSRVTINGERGTGGTAASGRCARARFSIQWINSSI